VNSGPGSKAEARRRNVQEKKFKLEEVPELKRLKRLSLRLHGPTRARPQLKIFKYSKVPQSTIKYHYPRFFLLYYELPIIIAYSLSAFETGWNWCAYVHINNSQIFTEQDCAPANVLISWDATDSCSCHQSGVHYHYEEVTCGDLVLPCVVIHESPWWSH